MTANWQNKTVFTVDNRPIMWGLNSESVDLIYLDPPFNSNANYAAPIGSKAAGAEPLEFHSKMTHFDCGVVAIKSSEKRL